MEGSTGHERYATLFLARDDGIVAKRARVVQHQWERQVAPLTRFEGVVAVSEALPTADWDALEASRSRAQEAEGDAVCDCDRDGMPLTWQGPFYDNYGNFYPSRDLIQYNEANAEGREMVPWSARYGPRR